MRVAVTLGETVNDSGGRMLVGTKSDTRGEGRRDAAQGPEAQARLTGTDGPADIGGNLRRTRTGQGHSLETLARLSGVSRAMLGQIETGKSVPTVTLLWKIATALGVPVSQLIDCPRTPRAVLLRREDARLVTSSGGQFALRPFTAQGFALHADFAELNLATGHRETAAAHAPGTRATLAVTAGTIEITLGGGAALSLSAGDAILFEADEAQTYANPGEKDAVAYLVVVPPRNGGG